MNRFYLRSLLDLSSHLLPFQKSINPCWRVSYLQNPHRRIQETQKVRNDPHTIFEQFFKENQIKHEMEKEFFQKHYPTKPVNDPFKTLQINKDASIQDVKEAYRKLAIKYHPKNNTSPEAQQKFTQIGEAYENIIELKNKRNEVSGFRSYFGDFEKEVSQLFEPKKEKENKSQVKDQIKNENVEKKQAKSLQNQKYVQSQLYSESSHFESVNGKQTKFVAEKVYKVDGKLLKVTRQQKLKEDGNLQITQTIDNGQQVKKKTFIQEKSVNRLTN